MATTKLQSRLARKKRIRAKLHGTADRPRLVVFRSLKNIHVQLINDDAGVTIASASNMKDKTNNIESATKIGTEIAELAKKAKVNECIFDRNGYRYHGRVKALADAARAAGLNF